MLSIRNMDQAKPHHTTPNQTAPYLECLPDLPVEVGVDLALAHHRHELRKIDQPIPVQVHLTAVGSHSCWNRVSARHTENSLGKYKHDSELLPILRWRSRQEGGNYCTSPYAGSCCCLCLHYPINRIK